MPNPRIHPLTRHWKNKEKQSKSRGKQVELIDEHGEKQLVVLSHIKKHDYDNLFNDRE